MDTWPGLNLSSSIILHRGLNDTAAGIPMIKLGFKNLMKSFAFICASFSKYCIIVTDINGSF